MFTYEQRARLRAGLIDDSDRDARVTGGAITGSAAENRDDRWSDIDLAFGVRSAADLPSLLEDRTRDMYTLHDAVHHFDLTSGPWLYRVFLLANTLQVDLGFATVEEFRALSPNFRLMFGDALEPKHADPTSSANEILGMGWVYALHVRSALGRNKLWQAEHMVSGVRNQALALACMRRQLPETHGRGFDQLPAEVLAKFEGSLVQRLDHSEISRAFRIALSGFLSEVESIHQEFGSKLRATLETVTETAVHV